MALQAAIVEIAFTATPFADPSTLTWTDVSSLVIGDSAINITRGRQYELAQMQSGTLDLTLNDPDGDFDPDNATGAYYPYVKIGVPIRVRTVYAGNSYTLYYGFVDSWQQSYTNVAEFLPTVKVTASDGLKTVLSYGIGQGYTEMLVQDYGGVVGSEFSFVWPFNDPNYQNYYLNSATSNAITSGESQITDAIAESAVQLSGAGAYFQFLAGDGDQWLGFDGWLRVDSATAGAPKCVFYSGNRLDTSAVPNLGFGTADGNTLSGWIIHYPVNLFAAAVADPTNASLWTHTDNGSLTTTAITSTNGAQRIWLDDGSTDFYGATSALHLVPSPGYSNTVRSPEFTASSGQTFGLGMVVSWSGNSSPPVTLQIEWVNPSGTIETTTTLLNSSAASGRRVVSQTITVPNNAQITAGRIAMNTSNGSMDLAQIIVVDGSWQPTWYATTPDPALLLIVGSGTGIAPPGQSNSATGWPCYATMTIPTQGEWFHLAVDGGMLNKNYYTAAGFAMPSAWLNGQGVRMWTTGPFNGTTWSGTGWLASIGAKVYFNGSVNAVLSATSVPVSADEFYIPDNNISTTGRVTAAKALAHYNYGLTRHDFVQQDTGARVTTVLDSLGWPTSLRSIDTGDNTILAQLPDTDTQTNLTGLSCIQDAANVEGGLYFIAGDGSFVFWSQTHALPSLSITVGDGPGDVPFQSGLALSLDDTYVYNRVQLTQNLTDGSAGTAFAVQSDDSTSQGDYKVRMAPALSAPWTTLTAMQSLADAIVAAYKQPATRVSSVQVECVTTDTFASILPREIGDKVRVSVHPKSTGPTVTVDGFIQGLQIAISAQQWLFTLALSPTLAGH